MFVLMGVLMIMLISIIIIIINIISIVEMTRIIITMMRRRIRRGAVAVAFVAVAGFATTTPTAANGCTPLILNRIGPTHWGKDVRAAVETRASSHNPRTVMHGTGIRHTVLPPHSLPHTVLSHIINM